MERISQYTLSFIYTMVNTTIHVYIACTMNLHDIRNTDMKIKRLNNKRVVIIFHEMAIKFLYITEYDITLVNNTPSRSIKHGH